MIDSMRKLRVSILDDYQDVIRTLDCFTKLQGHDITIWNDAMADVDVLAERLKAAEVLVLTYPTSTSPRARGRA